MRYDDIHASWLWLHISWNISWYIVEFHLAVLFLVSPPRGGRGFTIIPEKWSLMNNLSCVVKCHNLLRLPHKMKFLVPWFFMPSFSTLVWRSLKFFCLGIFRLCSLVKCHNLLRLPHKRMFLVPWLFMPSFPTLVWRSHIFLFFPHKMRLLVPWFFMPSFSTLFCKMTNFYFYFTLLGIFRLCGLNEET